MRTIIEPYILAVDLKEFRVKKGLTQKEIAAIIEVPVYTYQRWEKGHCRISPIMYKHLVRLGIIKPKNQAESNTRLRK